MLLERSCSQTSPSGQTPMNVMNDFLARWCLYQQQPANKFPQVLTAITATWLKGRHVRTPGNIPKALAIPQQLLNLYCIVNHKQPSRNLIPDLNALSSNRLVPEVEAFRGAGWRGFSRSVDPTCHPCMTDWQTLVRQSNQALNTPQKHRRCNTTRPPHVGHVELFAHGVGCRSETNSNSFVDVNCSCTVVLWYVSYWPATISISSAEGTRL